MNKFKRLLLALILVIFMIAPCFAQARYGLTVTPVATDTASALGAGTWVYGIGIYASSAAAAIGIYDTATLGAASNTNVKGEAGQATQYVSTTVWFEKPIYFSTAVTAIVNNGVGFIYSGPEPN